VGHHLVEQALLGAPVIEVVAPHLLAESTPGKIALLPDVDRLTQRGGKSLGLAGRVGVADQLGTGIAGVLDAVQSRGEQRREAEIRVDVRARYAALDAARGPVPDYPKTAGAVVPAPGDRGGGPALGRVA